MDPVSPVARPAILNLQSVTKRFANTPQAAVSDVSFQLPAGDLLTVLGPSGCGKTTLLRLIAGFEHPESGLIQVGGQTVAESNCWIPPEHRDIGIVFQEFALFPHLTVAQNIAFGLEKLPKAEIQKRLKDAISMVSLQGLEHRYPHQLSGGQQQRVALARALAPRPALILMDEPLSNLDVQVRLYLREEVRKILKQTGISGILVTHDQEEALAISDWVGVMHQGRLEQLGRPESIYRQPASRFVAEFVSQANFLPASRQGQSWATEVGSFSLPDTSVFGQDNTENSVLMIRQEDLQLLPDQAGDVMICERQFLGREYRYCLQTPSGQELHARTEQSLPVGIRVKLAVGSSSPPQP